MKKVFFLSLISKNPSTKIAPFSQCRRYGFSTQPFKPITKPLSPNFNHNTMLSNLKASSFMFHGNLERGFHHKHQPVSFRKPWQLHLTSSLTTSVVLGGLILANVGVHLVLAPIVVYVWKDTGNNFIRKNFMLQLDNFKRGRIHTMITCAFTHANPLHITLNMIPLYYFGNHIGQSFGPEFLLKLYLSGAFAGSAFFLVHKAFLSHSSKKRGLMLEKDPSEDVGAGASAAVNANMLLDLFYFPAGTVFHLKHVPGILLGIVTIVGDMIIIIQGYREIGGSAHMGGAVVAAIALVWGAA